MKALDKGEEIAEIQSQIEWMEEDLKQLRELKEE